MGHRQRATGGELFLEQRDDAAVAAEHVAEAGGDEMGLFGRAALNVDFGHTLGGAHHVGGVDSLVGRDHHKFFGAVLDGQVGNVLGSEHIDKNCLVWVLLHKGHVLVGCGVVDKIGTIFLKDLFHTRIVLNVGDDEGHRVDVLLVWLVIFQLELEVVHRRFCLVEHNNLLGFVLQQLAADFAADGACGARDEDRLVENFANDIDVVDLNRLTLQEVFNLDVLNLVGGESAIHPHRDMRDSLDRQSQVETAIGDGLLVSQPYGRNGDNELRNLLAVDKILIEDVASTHHRHAVELLVDLGFVVVDECHNPVFVVDILFEGVVGDDASGTGTIDDNIDLAAATAEILVVDIEYHKPFEQHQQGQQRIEQNQHSVGRDDVVDRRHNLKSVVQEIDYATGYGHKNTRQQDAEYVVESHMADDAPVGFKQVEEAQSDD